MASFFSFRSSPATTDAAEQSQVVDTPVDAPEQPQVVDTAGDAPEQTQEVVDTTPSSQAPAKGTGGVSFGEASAEDLKSSAAAAEPQPESETIPQSTEDEKDTDNQDALRALEGENIKEEVEVEEVGRIFDPENEVERADPASAEPVGAEEVEGADQSIVAPVGDAVTPEQEDVVATEAEDDKSEVPIIPESTEIDETAATLAAVESPVEEPAPEVVAESDDKPEVNEPETVFEETQAIETPGDNSEPIPNTITEETTVDDPEAADPEVGPEASEVAKTEPAGPETKTVEQDDDAETASVADAETPVADAETASVADAETPVADAETTSVADAETPVADAETTSVVDAETPPATDAEEPEQPADVGNNNVGDEVIASRSEDEEVADDVADVAGDAGDAEEAAPVADTHGAEEVPEDGTKVEEPVGAAEPDTPEEDTAATEEPPQTSEDPEVAPVPEAKIETEVAQEIAPETEKISPDAESTNDVSGTETAMEQDATAEPVAETAAEPASEPVEENNASSQVTTSAAPGFLRLTGESR